MRETGEKIMKIFMKNTLDYDCRLLSHCCFENSTVSCRNNENEEL